MSLAPDRVANDPSIVDRTIAQSGESERERRSFNKAASRIDLEHHPSDARVTWRRAAYRVFQDHVRAVKLIGVLPIVTNQHTLRSDAGNEWLRAETGLGDRAIAYGFAALAEAGLITVKAAGPRRTITLIIPQKPAHGMHPGEPI